MKRKLFLKYHNNEQKNAINEVIKSNPQIADFYVLHEKDLVFGYEDLLLKKETKDSENPLVLNNSLPIWNRSSYDAIKEIVKSDFFFVSSYEMTEWELSALYDSLGEDCKYMVRTIYGHIPMMYTKNCVKKTSGKCNHTSEIVYIKDRKNISFPVFCNCDSCSNIIYNSIPLSLHTSLEEPKGFMNEMALKLDFTIESGDMTHKILSYFLRLLQGKMSNLPYSGFTKSHNKQQVL